MENISIKENNPTLASLIDQVNESHQATIITIDDDKQAVLVPLDEWNSLQETLYLLSIPGVKEDLIAGKNTPWSDCIPLEEIKMMAYNQESQEMARPSSSKAAI